jgi:hypothetical protein
MIQTRNFLLAKNANFNLPYFPTRRKMKPDVEIEVDIISWRIKIGYRIKAVEGGLGMRYAKVYNRLAYFVKWYGWTLLLHLYFIILV